MRIRDLFTVPEGQKVTEKHLRRVLVSSVCSILLCMSCLVGTTWAWFTVSIENKDNVIWIGTPEVKLTVDGKIFESGTTFTGADHEIELEHSNETGDAFDKKADLYVILTFENEVETKTVYLQLNADNQYKTSLTVEANKNFVMRWQVSWLKPDSFDQTDGSISLIVEEPEETTEPTTETTIPATDPTVSESETSSEPTVETDTEPTENTTATTEAADPTDVSEETVQPTEENTPPEETEEQEQSQE